MATRSSYADADAVGGSDATPGSDAALSAELFRDAVEQAPSALLIVDADGRIVLANAEALAVFGYGRDELVGRSVELLVPTRFAGDHVYSRDGYFMKPQPRPMGHSRDLYATRKDGSEFPVEIGLHLIDPGGHRMVLAAVVDITERIRLQQTLETAVQDKSTLLNEVYHRVKNNLQVIVSMLNLQAASSEDTRLREALNESVDRVRAMVLTHQLLYERTDSRVATIDLGEYLGRLTQQLLSAYRAKGNDVGLTLTQPEERVRLDLDRSIPCGLVVNELVTNAFKHAFPGGRRRGEVAVTLDGAAADEIVLSVADDGIGLPPGFDFENTRSLGLQLVPLLVDQLLGDLTIGTAPGAHFTVRFPRRPLRRSSP